MLTEKDKQSIRSLSLLQAQDYRMTILQADSAFKRANNTHQTTTSPWELRPDSERQRSIDMLQDALAGKDGVPGGAEYLQNIRSGRA